MTAEAPTKSGVQAGPVTKAARTSSASIFSFGLLIILIHPLATPGEMAAPISVPSSWSSPSAGGSGFKMRHRESTSMGHMVARVAR
jgi:hypothetical protein